MPPTTFTLRFTEWRCGHHGQRPADIPVHSTEQAQLILQAIAHAISQPGHACAALYDEQAGTTIYLSDDHVEKISSARFPRAIVYHGSPAELEQLRQLGGAWEYLYGGRLHEWDGQARLDDALDWVTTLNTTTIEQAIQPIEWHEEGTRRAVCDVPPVLRPAATLLAELREAAEEMAAQAAMEEEGGAA